MVWFHSDWSVFSNTWESLGQHDGAVLSHMHKLMVLAVQHRLAHSGFLMVEEDDEERAQSGALGFQDQTRVIQWVQNSSVAFDVESAKVIIFRHSTGGWSACCYTFDTRHAEPLSGVVLQSVFCNDIQGMQRQQQSEKLV